MYSIRGHLNIVYRLKPYFSRVCTIDEIAYISMLLHFEIAIRPDRRCVFLCDIRPRGCSPPPGKLGAGKR